MSRALSSYRRVVVKIGSSLLVDPEAGALREDWLRAFGEDLAGLWKAGVEVLVVSSGAIALGRSVLGLPRGPLRLEESQASAAVGQIALARAYTDALGPHELTAAQILVTLGDTEERRRYLNARSTIGTLLRMRAIPVINENDTVATTEIRYGDNDRLAARVAGMMSADLLVLLSDIDGLYTAPPHRDPKAELIPEVRRITPEIEAMAGAAASEFSRGGMTTKIAAAKLALAAGCSMIIASGRVLRPLSAIDGGGRCTWFMASSSPFAARKGWIAGSLEPRGTVYVDAGAERALGKGRSLLPAGVTRVEGRFSRGDTIVVRGADGRELGRGLVAYDHEDAVRIAGRRSLEIEAILGWRGRDEMVHRDDLALGDEGLDQG